MNRLFIALFCVLLLATTFALIAGKPLQKQTPVQQPQDLAHESEGWLGVPWDVWEQILYLAGALILALCGGGGGWQIWKRWRKK